MITIQEEENLIEPSQTWALENVYLGLKKLFTSSEFPGINSIWTLRCLPLWTAMDLIALNFSIILSFMTVVALASITKATKCILSASLGLSLKLTESGVMAANELNWK